MAVIKVKSSVKGKNITIMAAIANVVQHFDLLLPDEVLITSANDSQHMPTSKHYSNDAIDVRCKNFPTIKEKKQFLQDILNRLGKNYQGFIEDLGKESEHIHLEFDPPQP